MTTVKHTPGQIRTPYPPDPGLTKYEHTVMAVVASGVCRWPGEYPRPDGGPTPDEQYAMRVLRTADAVWIALEKRDAKP